MRNLTTYVNIYYKPTDVAKLYYDRRKDELGLKLINGGSSFFYDCITDIAKGKGVDKWIMQNVIPDDVGLNISAKNHIFNELTSLYWIWNHFDYTIDLFISFCHYRLFFKEIPQELDKSTIYVHKPILMLFRSKSGYVVNGNIQDGYNICHIPYCWDAFERITKKYVYPEVFDDWKSQSSLTSPCNMFIMHKDEFKKYCEFMFPMIFEIENLIDMSKPEFENAYQHRQLAFISERIFSLWCYIMKGNGYKIEELDTIKIDEFKPFTDQDERNMKFKGAKQ